MRGFFCFRTAQASMLRNLAIVVCCTTWELGMRPEDGRRPPTLHGLRHYFAVERLTLWCQQGASVRDLAPNLSVYLGHVSPEESYWYLTSTPTLLMTAELVPTLCDPRG
jgi:integrase